MNLKKNFRSLSVLLAVIFSFSVIALWVYNIYGSSSVVAILGAGYALLCTGFLVAQLLAFVKAHMDYDQTIEKPKFDIIRLEAEEWDTV